jgi:hypothetical protein
MSGWNVGSWVGSLGQHLRRLGKGTEGEQHVVYAFSFFLFLV